ncbi:hypothetical protein KGQ64_05755 [bacterium]|nr:hypothetical protein [bacterium]
MNTERPTPETRRRGAAVLLAAMLAGCAPPAKDGDPFAAWRGAPGFDAAREACIDFAVERTSNFDGQATASKAAIGMFLDCMAGKGFAPADSRN